MWRRIVTLNLVLLLASLLASCAVPVAPAGVPQETSTTEELTLQLGQTPTLNPPASKPAETAKEDDTASNRTPETTDQTTLSQNPSAPQSAAPITEVNPILNQTPSSVTGPQYSLPSMTGPTKAPGINITELEMQIHSLINAERTKQGLSLLTWNDRLSIVARKHSEDMAQRNYFDHTSPEGYGPMERCTQAGLAIRGCAENIFLFPLAKTYWYENGALAYTEYYTQDKIAPIVVQGWMNSPGHRKNILTAFWASEGIGVGISTDNKVYITEDFN